MEDERETKKKRLSLACNVCRRKKIKCDGIKPTCGKCQKFNQECSYTSNIKKRGPRQGHIELLEQRLKKMEELMTAGNSSNPNDVPAPLHASTASPLPAHQQPLAGYTVIQTQPPPSLHYKPQQPIIQQSYHQLYSSGDLPNSDIMEHLLDLFFKNCGTVCSIVDIQGFRNSVANKTCNPFLLYAVLAVAARFSNRSDIIESPVWMSGEKYASKARAMIDQVIEKPSIDNCQGLLILSVNEYGCARGPRCWTYTGLAIRMAIELGLHKEKIFEEGNQSIIPLDRWYWYETRRKLFWEAFIHDKFASASTGRPSALNPLDCEILMPVDCNVLELESGNDFYQSNIDKTRLIHYHIIRDTSSNHAIKGVQYSQLDPTLPENKLYFNRLGWDSRILQEVVILDKVTQLVNRGYQQNGSSAYAPYEENSEFEKIDIELDQWIENLPLQIRNTPANLELYRSSSTVRSAQFVLAHIMHNALIVLLNRPSLVIADMPGLGQVSQSVQDKVHRSMEKCLAAADNVTVMLKDLCCKIEVVPPFTAYLAYTTATVLVNSSFSMNLLESQKAEMALKAYFRFLAEMKVYWAMADKLYFMIRDLYALHTKVLSTVQKNQKNQLNSTTASSTTTVSTPSTQPILGPSDIWNTSMTTVESPPSTAPFINPYPIASNSTIPIRRLPIADLSLTTSDLTMNQNWDNNLNSNTNNNDNTGGFFSFHHTPGGRNTSRPNIFNEPAFPAPLQTTAANPFSINSFDMWLQQQQQHSQQQRQQHEHQLPPPSSM